MQDNYCSASVTSETQKNTNTGASIILARHMYKTFCENNILSSVM